jgi:hypothetical protein
MTESASRGIRVDADTLERAVGLGLAVIVPVAFLVEVLDRSIDDFDETAWVALPFFGILAGYALAGWYAARRAPASPYLHAFLASVAAAGAWILIRVVVLAFGRGSEFTVRSAIANLLLAAAFGLGASALAGRERARPSEPPREAERPD